MSESLHDQNSIAIASRHASRLAVSRPARLPLWLVLPGVLALLLCPTRDATAQQEPVAKASCATAAEGGQLLSREGKLLEALDQFRRCAHRSCPSVIASDCLRFVAETQARIPSLVFRAQDDRGRDLTEVTVRVDGKFMTEHLDGRAVELNPGRHEVAFEVRGHDPMSRQVVVAEGEKARVISFLFETEPALPVESGPHGPPVATWVLGGVGAASLVGFAYFGLTAKSERDELASTCGVTRTCSDSQVDGFREKALVADVFLGVSVASLATAGLVWALSNDEPNDSQPVETVSIVVEPAGGVVRWQHAF